MAATPFLEKGNQREDRPTGQMSTPRPRQSIHVSEARRIAHESDESAVVMMLTPYFLFPLVAVMLVVRPVDGTPLPYSLYVWAQVFQPQTCGTSPNGAYVSWRNETNWNEGCFTRPYDTPAQRSFLFDAFRPGSVEDGRKVNKIFLSVAGTPHSGEDGKIEGIEARARALGPLAACPVELMTTIAEARLRDVKVYALFGDSCHDLCEKEKVADVVAYNRICAEVAQDDIVQFDGVAINNEYLTKASECGGRTDIDPDRDVREWRDNAQIWLDLLNGLQTAKDRLEGLPLHFSLGHRWAFCDDDSPREIVWEGSLKKVVEHMMDIIDSVDIQVAWAKVSDDEEAQDQTIVDRAQFYHRYWFDTLGHPFDPNDPSFYVLAYTNPVSGSECQTSFAPHSSGDVEAETSCMAEWGDWRIDRTQEGMFAAFDVVEQGLGSAAGSIHYYGGVYNTGITEGWPINKKWQIPGDLCSQDSDCAFTASCDDVDTSSGRYAEKRCAKMQPPTIKDPYKLCLPKGFECKSNDDCCKGLKCAHQNCNDIWCKYKYVIPSRCEPER